MGSIHVLFGQKKVWLIEVLLYSGTMVVPIANLCHIIIDPLLCVSLVW